MTVLRTETKTIPAQTIEITVIGVPAYAWKRMKWKIGISAVLACTCLFSLLTFYWSGMPGVENTANFAHAALGLDIENKRNHDDLWRLILFGISLCMVLVFTSAIDYIIQAEDTLLQKHGWDGTSPKLVELEYPQHFLLD